MRLELEAVGKRYGEAWAVRGLSLVVPGGQIAVLLGHNGAGKSTTLRLAAGILAPTEGRVRVESGLDAGAGEGAWRRAIGYLPEEGHLLDYLTAPEYLAYVGQLHGIDDEDELEARVAEVGALLGLAERGEARIGELSAGMRRRVSIAAALVDRPRLLLLDEPTNFLDPIGVKILKDVLARGRTAGVGVLLATHRLDVAEELADQVVVLEHGREVFQGSLEALRRRVPGGDAGGSLEGIYTSLLGN